MTHKLIEKMAENIRTYLRMSPRVHIRQNDIANLGELLSLFDRFIDDKILYPLEWDDFISWESNNPSVESIRLRIGEYESLLFSDKLIDRTAYGNKVVEERNKIAVSLGLPSRQFIGRIGRRS